MDCNTAKELMVADARGELLPEQAGQLAKHLETCPSCRWQADAAKRTVEVIEQAGETNIVELAAQIINQAISGGASDIHLDPHQGGGSVKLRVDGVLRQILSLPEDVHRRLVARMHVMGEVDPFERHVPQSGRIDVRSGDREYHLRVTTLPTFWGPKVTLRIFDAGQGLVSVSAMDLSPEVSRGIEELMHAPYGLVVFSGPTGSGKTTTMYACLNLVRSPAISVMAVEDPVAAVLEGVTQVSVNSRAGVDYPTALKGVLGSDPDVVAVGHLPDATTASAAADLALTGHLVLTQVHTQDAPNAVVRLLDIGLNERVLADCLLGVTCQRLVRKVCPDCKEEYEPAPDEVAFLHELGVEQVPEKLWRGAGCEKCRTTGYRGRTVIVELLRMTPDLLEAIARGRYTEALGRQALGKPMAADGARKALAGITTVHEVRRVTARPGA